MATQSDGNAKPSALTRLDRNCLSFGMPPDMTSELSYKGKRLVGKLATKPFGKISSLAIGMGAVLRLLVVVSFLAPSLASASTRRVSQTLIQWGCQLFVLVHRTNPTSATRNASGYLSSDFPSSSLSKPYRKRAKAYQKAQAQIANYLTEAFAAGMDPRHLSSIAASALAIEAQKQEQGVLFADRRFGERRNFELESGIPNYASVQHLIPLSFPEQTDLIPRFEAEFEHFVERTDTGTLYSSEEWAAGIQNRRILYYHTTADHYLPVAILFDNELSRPNYLNVLHASPEDLDQISEDIFARLRRVRETGIQTAAERQDFWTAYFGFLMALPYSEGNEEIAIPLFAAIFLGSTGEKYDVILSKKVLWENALVSQEHFVTFMERQFRRRHPSAGAFASDTEPEDLISK